MRCASVLEGLSLLSFGTTSPQRSPFTSERGSNPARDASFFAAAER